MRILISVYQMMVDGYCSVIVRAILFALKHTAYDVIFSCTACMLWKKFSWTRGGMWRWGMQKLYFHSFLGSLFLPDAPI